MKHLICFLLLSLTFFDCNKSDTTTNPSVTGDFVPLPLKVGNTWIYSHIVSSQTSQDTFSIVNTTTINSRIVYVLNDQWLFDKNGAYYDQGILYGMRVSGPDQKLEVIYPKNPVIGQTWYIYDFSSTFRLEALNESVTVPAGTFSCSHLAGIFDDGFSCSVWFSNGKGIIKASLPSESYELISLTLN